jgi:hypothetical protein
VDVSSFGGVFEMGSLKEVKKLICLSRDVVIFEVQKLKKLERSFDGFIDGRGLWGVFKDECEMKGLYLIQ